MACMFAPAASAVLLLPVAGAVILVELGVRLDRPTGEAALAACLLADIFEGQLHAMLPVSYAALAALLAPDGQACLPEAVGVVLTGRLDRAAAAAVVLILFRHHRLLAFAGRAQITALGISTAGTLCQELGIPNSVMPKHTCSESDLSI